MKGLALVVGAGGIGTQLAKDLNESEKDLEVVLCGRKSEFNPFWELDIEDSQSLLQLKNKISNHPSKLRLLLMLRVDFIVILFNQKKDYNILIKKICWKVFQ